jgi:hypothetical protein
MCVTALTACGLPTIHSPFAATTNTPVSGGATPTTAPSVALAEDPATSDPSRTGSPVPATTTPTTGTATATTDRAARQASSVLDTLLTTTRPIEDGTYQREAFGASWADIDGNGCNQRDDVLQRDAVPGTLTVAQQGACNHDVIAGTWHDPYTGRTLVFTNLKDLGQAMAIQIDHIVPLAEAWYSSARDWSAEKRQRFANDLPELLAVDGPTNESKGDGDPAAWRPRKGFQCEYAERWIAVKSTWGLTVDPSEIHALTQMLAYC